MTTSNRFIADPPEAGEPVESVLRWVWGSLETGAAKRRHPFHQGCVATVGAQGEPCVRTVVLRGTDRGSRQLWFHTDRRSPKIDQVGAHGRMEWLFYDQATKVQVRASGTAEVATDGARVDAAWDRTTLFGKRCYLAPAAPGSVAAEPESPNLPEDLRGIEPSDERAEHGRTNFAMVFTTVERIDWLYLAHTGHRRAMFSWDSNGGIFDGAWIEP